MPAFSPQLRRKTAALALTFATAGCLAALGGCLSAKGGIMPYTGGAQVYHSSEALPVSVMMVDVRNGETFFSIDVPPGQQFAYQIMDGKGDNEVYTPDLMKYGVMKMGNMSGSLGNAMSCPPETAIRVDVYYRDGGEYRPMPPEAHYRSDQLASRQGWWSSRGGPMPNGRPSRDMYDSDH